MRAAAALRGHWPEYLAEAAGLGAIMLVSAAVTATVEVPLLPVPEGLPPLARRTVEGAAIAGTAVAAIHSRWGRRSGAHFNPAVTLTFLALGKVRPWDAAFYAVAQVLGGLAGLLTAALLLGDAVRQPPTAWIVTVPGGAGVAAAFLAELLCAFLLMSLVLALGGSPRAMRFTGVAAGALIFLYIVFEAPISGFGLNPARSLASALPAGVWTAFWIYLLAPPLGMLAAAALSRALPLWRPMPCAKLIHDTATRCIHCGFRPAAAGGPRADRHATDRTGEPSHA
ncbi:MAG: aquaporin [Acetobacteraceae bacterium]|nr:aquaporin [Acetobacteraceae bacterium]